MLMTTLSLTAGHAPAGSLVVKIKVTLPFVISVPLGVYDEVAELILENDPVPFDHVTEDALPPKSPARLTAAPLHDAKLAPASTVAAVLTVKAVVPIAEVQPFTVTVNEYVPAFMACAFPKEGF